MAVPVKKNVSTIVASLLLVLVLFVNGSFVKLATGSSDSPFIVAQKKVKLSKINSNAERVSVVIDIYNRGSATAYDISLTDDSWDKDAFHAVIGNTSRSWDKLDAGSLVSHSFELETRVKSIYHGSHALIKYRDLKEAKLKEAYSTPSLPLEILAEKTLAKKLGWAKNLLAAYGSHVAVVAIVALFTHIILTPPKTSKKKQ